jgi:uncharacterized coiled-coil protein SlyX
MEQRAATDEERRAKRLAELRAFNERMAENRAAVHKARARLRQIAAELRARGR